VKLAEPLLLAQRHVPLELSHPRVPFVRYRTDFSRNHRRRSRAADAATGRAAGRARHWQTRAACGVV
jgi:hypothetical protein